MGDGVIDHVASGGQVRLNEVQDLLFALCVERRVGCERKVYLDCPREIGPHQGKDGVGRRYCSDLLTYQGKDGVGR